ncbi:hypothetical protein EPAKOI_003649 [Cupriavidus sp. H18C2]
MAIQAKNFSIGPIERLYFVDIRLIHKEKIAPNP